MLESDRCFVSGVNVSVSHLTLHECRVQPPLPALQAAAGLRPAVIGRAESLLELLQLGAVAPQEVTAAQVDGDHQTLVAVEGLLHVLDKETEEMNVCISPAATFLHCSTCFHAAVFVCHVLKLLSLVLNTLFCVKPREKKFSSFFFLREKCREKKRQFVLSF